MELSVTALDGRLRSFYRLAGILALLIVLVGLIDALTSMGIEARDNRSVDGMAWFVLFQTRPFAAFSSLGLFNIITLSLGIPVYLAFSQLFSREHLALSALAAILFFIGAIVYFSSNTVFPLFALSRQYAASPEAQKPLLEAAARALLAQGADLTPGTFWGLLFAQIAGLLVGSLMLRVKAFGRWIGITGLAGYSLMVIFFVLAAFFPERYDTAMMIAVPAGLVLLAYQVMLARGFFQLSK